MRRTNKRADDDRLTVLSIRLTILLRYGGRRLVKLAEKRTGTRDEQDDVDRTKRVHGRHDCGGGGGEFVTAVVV